MFISEILSPECVVLGTETDLRKKNVPCYMFCTVVPKIRKNLQKLILRLFLACFISVDPLIFIRF